jgi:AraC-like DNA-binding protein
MYRPVDPAKVASADQAKVTSFDPAEVTPIDPADDFLKKALAFIEENMGESDLSVDQLAKALLMSRSGLYKKLLAITGKTPVKFLRLIKLKRAAQWLEKSDRNVKEIAYMVGFSNPKYFARYFKEEFHMLPSAYRAKKF